MHTLSSREHQAKNDAPLYLVVNGRVADDNGDHREQEPEEEQELLGRGSFYLEDGAGEGGRIEAQATPQTEERRDHHAEGEEPDQGDHEVNEVLTVHAVVEAVVSDEDVPEGGGGG